MERYNKDYNDNLKSHPEWDIIKAVKKECGEKIFDYLSEPGFFYNLDIQKDAKEVVDYLSKYYDLYVVTAYLSETCVDKSKWIEKHDLTIPKENIIFINDKSILTLDYLIDDGPHNINNFGGFGIVYDMPYNQQNSLDKKPFARVKNWKQIKDLFEKEVKFNESYNKIVNKR